MSDKPKVYVAGIGMITPVGANAEMTAAAVRAGVSAYESSRHHNKRFYPMRMALVPDDALPALKPELEAAGLPTRQRRMLRLATPALQEVLKSVPLAEAPPLFLALPEHLPDCPAALKGSFLEQLQIQTGMSLDMQMSRTLATGRAGGLQAIDLAFKYFDSTGKNVVVVGGVDTYRDPFLLGVLDSRDRILSESTSDGFAPGEAAGFLLLVSERVVNKLPGQPKTHLYAPGLAIESGHRYSQEPYRGDGLASAFRGALDHANGSPIDAIYASVNGESFWVKELGVASIRNKASLRENVETEHPADCVGDIGAAFGPVLIGLMAKQRAGNYLGCCSSDQQARAAIVVAAA